MGIPNYSQVMEKVRTNWRVTMEEGNEEGNRELEIQSIHRLKGKQLASAVPSPHRGQPLSLKTVWKISADSPMKNHAA